MGVPDGTTADSQQDPGTPEQQIADEIAANRMGSWLFSALGVDFRSGSGGGGEGGQFMFANLAELDAVIAAWREEVASIAADRRQIEITREIVDRPAGDTMSVYQTQATRHSLGALSVHNEEMLSYADAYLKKLTQTRQQMQNDEDAGVASMRNVYRGTT